MTGIISINKKEDKISFKEKIQMKGKRKSKIRKRQDIN